MTEQTEHHDDPRGILYASGAYAIWGVMPLYWHVLGNIPAFEVALHRVVWCALVGMIVTFARGRLIHVVRIVRNSRLMMALCVSSLLVGANWTIYIYSVGVHRLIEASLGYYLIPLLSIALGVLLLGEKISRIRIAAICLATAAVVVQAISLGSLPWIAPALALTFGFYGYVRKLTPVDSLDGLTIETCLLLPIGVPLLVIWAVQGTAAFPSAMLTRNAMLIATGPLTAVPLTLFAAGARRIRMTTLGFLQYLSPTISLLIATLILGEPFTRTNAITFSFVWSALVLVSLEGRIISRAQRAA